VASPPTGIVTFLFTDIEGSTKLWERHPEAMQTALALQDEILRGATEQHGGYVFKTVGDAFCCAFPITPDALEATLEAQRRLLFSEWKETGPLRVRMALHMGAAEERGGDYFGPPVNRVARLLSAAHGGQVLLSLPTHEMVRDQLPAGMSLVELGEHRLKDLFRPERVFQLSAPDLPSEFPPLRTLDAYRNNLPLQPTPLVGREKEVVEVCQILRDDETRLLTLTGPGGIGKTRVALQTAADLLDDFPDGTYFVPLATLTEAELFYSAVAETLGVKETAEQPLDESLKDYLAERRLLLLLDNFEQVLEAAPTVTEMIAGASGLKVLVTSRTPLRLYGEKEYAVPPLSVPDVRHLPDLKALSQYEAVRLFIERAKSAKVAFEITDENAPAVAEICVRLDGLPLTIELAAARIKMLPPKAMLHRLGSRLKLLTGGARDLPERQRTLRATIEWSFALLDEGEQLLFGRLAVFSGGRTLEAIEAICDAEGNLPVEAFEGISSLVDKSLLRQEEGPPNGEPRFVMLETIHEFAREKLQGSGEAEEIRRMHAEYFLTLAEEAYPELKGANQLEWLERLEAEHDNLRAALSWALKRKEVELALRLGGALSWFWSVRGYHSEGRRWLEEALAIEGRVSPEVQAMALAGEGALALEQGDYDRAKQACEEGLELLAQEAKETASEAKLIFLSCLGFVALEREEHSQAKQLYEESLTLSREMSDIWWLASSLANLALVTHSLGNYERATELYKESMDLFVEQGDKQSLAFCLNNLARVGYSQGDLGRAAKLTEEGVGVSRELGARVDVALGLCNLGWIALLQDDLGRAADIYKESLTLSWDTGMNPLVQSVLEGLACLDGAKGERERAARLWGAAQALHETKGIPRDTDFLAEADVRISAVRLSIAEEAWEEAWRKGRAMTLDEAVSYALAGEEEASG
jgi:predicted ATPase/class 3 adenylate cyclase